MANHTTLPIYKVAYNLLDAIEAAAAVIEQQRRMFFSIPAGLISSQATTQQIKMLMEDRAC